MNIRVLDKNDKAALEQLIFTIENALLFRNGGFLLMILNARISLMLTGHAS